MGEVLRIFDVEACMVPEHLPSAESDLALNAVSRDRFLCHLASPVPYGMVPKCPGTWNGLSSRSAVRNTVSRAGKPSARYRYPCRSLIV